MATDLYLLGIGIRGLLQLTEEARQALSAARVIYVLHNDEHIVSSLEKFAPVRDVSDLYEGEEIRAQVYRRISEELVSEAASGPGVAFVVHGHPLFLVSATEYTLELARERGLNVSLLPGISSLDTIFCDLEADLGYALQSYDATTLIANEYLVDPRVPLLVFQVATTMNPRVTYGEVNAAALQPLVNYLLKFYDPHHPCVVIHSGSTVIEPTQMVRSTLGEVARSGANLTLRPTLFLPAVQ